MLVLWSLVEFVGGSNGSLTGAAGTSWLEDSEARWPYECVGNGIGRVCSQIYRETRRNGQRVRVFCRRWVGLANDLVIASGHGAWRSRMSVVRQSLCGTDQQPLKSPPPHMSRHYTRVTLDLFYFIYLTCLFTKICEASAAKANQRCFTSPTA